MSKSHLANENVIKHKLTSNDIRIADCMGLQDRALGWQQSSVDADIWESCFTEKALLLRA